MGKDNLMKRMKDNYESRSRHYLTRRTPVILRIDGKAFHTYTRGLVKPFDLDLVTDMQATTMYLCENIQGAMLGYCQSDEISILLNDYKNLNTDAYFNYEVQKVCSISASLATSAFNSYRAARKYLEIVRNKEKNFDPHVEVAQKFISMRHANFDSRAFNVPKEEVANYFLARQNDAIRNSISALAQSLYSHKELNGKSQVDMQELAFQKGHNWNDLAFDLKRGATCVKGDESGWQFIETPLKFNNDFFNTYGLI